MCCPVHSFKASLIGSSDAPMSAASAGLASAAPSNAATPATRTAPLNAVITVISCPPLFVLIGLRCRPSGDGTTEGLIGPMLSGRSAHGNPNHRAPGNRHVHLRIQIVVIGPVAGVGDPRARFSPRASRTGAAFGR